MASDDVVIDIKAKDKTSAGIKKAENSFKSLAKTIGPLVAIGFGIAAVKNVTDAYIRQENAIAQLDQRLKSTNNAVGISSRKLQEMASSLQSVTTYGDEAIIEMQSLLLTFTKVGAQTFPQATEAILNMSTAMGQDLKTSAIQVGKALNDPVAGIAAMSRSGIQFTDSQKEMIKSLTKSGDLLGAQTIILKELETQFGGAARAAKNTLGGAMQSAENDIGDLAESIGGLLAPKLAELANTASYAARTLREMIDPTLQGDIATLYKEIEGINNLLGDEEVLNGENSYIGKGLQKQIDERLVQIAALEQKLKDINAPIANPLENITPTESVRLPATPEQAVSNFEAQLAAQQQFNTEAIELEQAVNDYKRELYEEDLRAKKDASDKKAKAEKEAAAAGMQALSDLGSLMNSESKKAFEIGKAASIAQATINTYESATSAFKALSGIPVVGPALGAVAAAAAVAAGLANIQSISSTQFGGKGSGKPAIPSFSGTGGVASQPTQPVTQPQTQQLRIGDNVEVRTGSILGVLIEEQIIPALVDAQSRGVALVIN